MIVAPSAWGISLFRQDIYVAFFSSNFNKIQKMEMASNKFLNSGSKQEIFIV